MNEHKFLGLVQYTIGRVLGLLRQGELDVKKFLVVSSTASERTRLLKSKFLFLKAKRKSFSAAIVYG